MIEKYLKTLKNNNYSINTISTYRSILKKFDNNFDNLLIIKRILNDFYPKPSTFITIYNVLIAYLKYVNSKLIDKIKSIKKPKIELKYKKTFEAEFLYRVTKDLSIYRNVVIRFLFETGLRASELKSIKEINYDTIVVKGKGDKIREVFHNWETTKLFKGFSYSNKTLNNWIKYTLGNEYTAHSIRRSHATHLLLNGANPKMVMLQLGHSSIETTYRYLQLSKKYNKLEYDKVMFSNNLI